MLAGPAPEPAAAGIPRRRSGRRSFARACRLLGWVSLALIVPAAAAGCTKPTKTFNAFVVHVVALTAGTTATSGRCC